MPRERKVLQDECSLLRRFGPEQVNGRDRELLQATRIEHAAPCNLDCPVASGRLSSVAQKIDFLYVARSLDWTA